MAGAQDALGAVLGLLANAMSTDSAIQKQAEKSIRAQIDLNPEMMVGALVHLVSQQSTPPEARALCAVLLRRNLPIGEPMVLNKLSPALQADLKQRLLGALAHEPLANVRKLLCDTVAELAQITLYRREWDQLVPALEHMSRQSSDALRESALVVLGKIGDALPDVQSGNLAALVQLFARGLADASVAVRVAALNAVSATFKNVDETQVALFHAVRAPILAVVRDLLRTGDAAAQSSVSALIDVASRSASFFRPDLPAVVDMVSHAVVAVDDGEVQQLILELAATIVEGAPNASRKCAALLEASLSLSLALMVAFDEEQETWDHAAKPWDANEDAGFGAGESAIDRIARSVGGKKITPIVVALVNKALSDTASWKSRFAALMALTQASEVISAKRLPEMVPLVLNYVGDASPFVQYAAINCIGQMCTDFGPDIQNGFHASILPTLLAAMDQSRHPRVQSHAAAAIINFSEHCQVAILRLYADTLVSNLYHMLQRPQRIIQEQAMTAIASVAECISTSFAKFYDHFVPLLKYAISHANGPDDAMFRGRALECVTFIGMAVGPERFAPDANDVMQATIKIVQAGGFASDDLSYSYMIQAWTRICTALGAAFVPYCDVVVPTVLKSAQTKCVLGRIDDDDEERGEQQIFEIGDEQYGISTNQIEEKSLGCSALGSFVSILKKHFLRYLPQTVDTLVPLLKFHFEENIKQSAGSALPDLLFSALDAHIAGLCDADVPKRLAVVAVKSLLDALLEEEDVYCMSTFVNAIQLCFDKCASRAVELFPLDLVRNIKDQIVKMVQQSEQRVQTQANHHAGDDEADDDDDEEAHAASREAEEQLQYMLAECLGAMIKNLKSHFLPVFNETLPVLGQMLDPGAGRIPRKIAVFVFDDFVEAMGRDSGPYIGSLLPLVGRYLNDPEPDIRQAVAYGFAVCAQHAGTHFAPYAAGSAQSLVEMVQHAGSRQTSSRRATDNAIAALGRIIRYQAEHVDCARLTPIWISMLPIRDDVQESVICTHILCDLVQSNNVHALGADMSNLGRIVHILVDVYRTKLSNEPLDLRIAPLLQQLPGPILSQIVAKLPADLREKLAGKTGH